MKQATEESMTLTDPVKARGGVFRQEKPFLVFPIFVHNYSVCPKPLKNKDLRLYNGQTKDIFTWFLGSVSGTRLFLLDHSTVQIHLENADVGSWKYMHFYLIFGQY